MPGNKNKKKIAVLGFPIKHSLSPKIHNYWLKKNNLKGSYTAIETPLNNLKKTITKLCRENYVGVNLTIPLKEKAVNYLDKSDDIVNFTGAVNTIIFQDKKFIEGKNTDVEGFKKSLLELVKNKVRKKAIIIGNGGAARAVLYALLKLKYQEIIVCARNVKKSSVLKNDMKKLESNNFKTKIILNKINNLEKQLKKTNLLVNTTPLGMKGFGNLNFPIEYLEKKTLVFDLVYNPVETRLLNKAKKNGNKSTNGLRMLLYQAQESFNEWFHIKPKITKELENIIKGKVK